MKKNELIKKLEAIPGNPEVAIHDFLRNFLHNGNEDDGHGTGNGIYTVFSIDKKKGENTRDGAKPWVALSFKNTFIEEDTGKGSLDFLPKLTRAIFFNAFVYCLSDKKNAKALDISLDTVTIEKTRARHLFNEEFIKSNQ